MEEGLTLKVLVAQLKGLECVVAGKGDQVEAPVHSVVGPNHSNVADHHFGKEKLLPGTTEVLRAVDHCHPVFAVQ